MVNLSGLTSPLTAGIRSRLAGNAAVSSEAVVTAVRSALSEVAMLGVSVLAVVSDVSSLAE